jgi:hypothetical protein
MFLTNPTTKELQLLDLPVLMEMLAKQTTDYIQLFHAEGFTSRTMAARELLHGIQEAIESKRLSGLSMVETASSILPQTKLVQGEQLA